MTVGGNILSRLRRGTIEAFALHAVGAALLFGMHAAITRSVGPEGYGVFTYSIALAGLLAVIVPLGWPTALMRFVAGYREEERWGLLRGVVARAHQITALTAGVAALALWGCSYLGFVPTEISISMRFAALILPFLSFVALRRKALQGLQRVRYSIIPEEILVPLLVLLGVYVLAVSTATGALLLYAVAALAAFVMGSLWVWRSMPEEGKTKVPEYETRAWMIVALPMVFGGFSQVVMNRTDLLMLGALTTDMGSVGLYGAAVRIATLNTFVLFAVNTMAAPMMAAAYHAGRGDRVRTVFRGAILFSTLGALPLFAAMFLFPEFILGFFGERFTEGASILRILAVGQFINAATGPVGFALMMTGREKAFALTTGLVACGTVLGHLIAIPAYGAVGAAVVTAASVISLNTSQYLLSRSYR